MRNPAGEAGYDLVRQYLNRRLKLVFHGSRVTSADGWLALGQLNTALGLTALARSMFTDSRTDGNGWHAFSGFLRQSVCWRFAGYKDVKVAERIARDLGMRWNVGSKAVERDEEAATRRPLASRPLIRPDLQRNGRPDTTVVCA